MSEPEQLDLLDWLAAQPPGPAPAAPCLEVVDLPINTEPLLLTRVDPSCNMRRFYSVALATSLFGVVRRWGRIGRQGQSRTDWYERSGPAEAVRQMLVARKRRRGYVPVGGP